MRALLHVLQTTVEPACPAEDTGSMESLGANAALMQHYFSLQLDCIRVFLDKKKQLELDCN